MSRTLRFIGATAIALLTAVSLATTTYAQQNMPLAKAIVLDRKSVV